MRSCEELMMQRRLAFDELAVGAASWRTSVEPPFLQWHRQRIHEAAIELLERYMPPLARRAVDMGCGTGDAMQHWAAFPHVRVCGLDFSHASLRALRLRSADYRKRGATPLVVQGDADAHLPFPDELFDVVYEYGLDFVLTMPRVALGEWLRILRPGGILVASFGPRYSIGHWTYARKSPLGSLAPARSPSFLDRVLPGRNYYRFYSADEIHNFIEAAPGRYRILEEKPLWYYYVEGRAARLLNRAGRRFGANLYDQIDVIVRRLYPIPSGLLVVARKEC
jgi:SAM-dependent methyltransferase